MCGTMTGCCSPISPPSRLAVADTRSRKRKAELLGEALRRLDQDEIEAGVAYLSGELRQRRTGVGWASLKDLPAPAGEPSLQVREVDAALEHVAGLSGPGSQTARREAIARAVRAARLTTSSASSRACCRAASARARSPA